jgi:hypothetical protein
MKDLAVIVAEDLGVVEYTVIGETMVYYANYPVSKETYKVVVDLVTHETTRTLQKSYLKKGNANMYL